MIHITSLHIRAFLTNELNTDDNYNHIRFIVFKIPEPNGTFVESEVLPHLLDLNGLSATQYPLFAPYNPRTLGNYRILHDKLIQLNSGDKVKNLVFPTKVWKRFQIKIPLNLKVHYVESSTGATAANYVRNFIGIMVFSDSGAPNHPVLTMKTRVYFKDV